MKEVPRITTSILFHWKAWILFCALVVSSLSSRGCDSNKLSKPLEDNPFQDQTKTLKKITILTCQGYVFELPDHLQISQLAPWPHPSDILPLHRAPAIDPVSRELWAKNGLDISVAPLRSWPQLRQELIQSGAKSVYENRFWLRNPHELAEFDTAWPEKDASFFLTDQNNHLHGYSASAGTCLFRFNAAPLFDADRKNQLRFHLVPVFRSDKEQTYVSRDKNNYLRIHNENQVIVFKQLLLSGTMDPESFIAITVSNKDEAIGNLGRYFLVNRNQKGHAQRVLFLVPKRIEAQRALPPS